MGREAQLPEPENEVANPNSLGNFYHPTGIEPVQNDINRKGNRRDEEGRTVTPALLASLSFLIAHMIARQVAQNAKSLGLDKASDHRSMHTGVVAHGGGIGIVIAGTLSGLVIGISNDHPQLYLPVLAALGLGITGLLDDLYHLPRHIRLSAQFTLAATVVGSLSPLPDPIAPNTFPTPLLGALAVIAAVWWINLFNFMDGIDSLASTEGIFLLISGAAAVAYNSSDWTSSPELIWMLCVAAACVGFLPLNWPPARLFMGDTSSLYLPIVIFAVALATINQQLATYPFWITLVAAFVSDATVTLIRRIFTGQTWIDSHRTHTYQKLALRFGKHLPALLIYNAINVFWLLPLALGCLVWPQFGWWIAIVAYLPLIFFALHMRAGQP